MDANKYLRRTLLAILVVLLLAMGSIDGDTALHDRQYCDMVRLHVETQGEYGWPPYRGDELTC